MKIRMLWHSDYWDGPMTGLALVNGEKVWFHFDGEDPSGPRTFAIYRLPPDLLDLLEMWHRVFQEHVGEHCDYLEDGTRTLGVKGTEESRFTAFFVPYRLACEADPRLKMKPETMATLEKIGTWREGEDEMVPKEGQEDST